MIRSNLPIAILATLLAATITGFGPAREAAPGKGSKPLNVHPPHVSTDKSVQYDYDIVYVRVPRDPSGKYLNAQTRAGVWSADVSFFDRMPAGGDLMLLHPDGKEEVLAVAGTYKGPDGKLVKVPPLSDEDKLTLVRWIDLGSPIDCPDPKDPDGRLGWLLDEGRPTLTLTVPGAGPSTEPLTHILLGMYDYGSGLDMNSFSVTADFPLDGAAVGENLAARFQAKGDGVWELKLTKPVTSLAKAKLTVLVKDHQGNLSRIERSFSVSAPSQGRR